MHTCTGRLHHSVQLVTHVCRAGGLLPTLLDSPRNTRRWILSRWMWTRMKGLRKTMVSARCPRSNSLSIGARWLACAAPIEPNWSGSAGPTTQCFTDNTYIGIGSRRIGPKKSRASGVTSAPNPTVRYGMRSIHAWRVVILTSAKIVLRETDPRRERVVLQGRREGRVLQGFVRRAGWDHLGLETWLMSWSLMISCALWRDGVYSSDFV